MLFDIRGRRKNVVKVVYALLAVLMGLSLFLVVGGFNLSELFSNNTSSGGEASKPFEEQAERLEVRLKKEPDNPELLVSLTRAQVSAGNSLLSLEPDQEDYTNALQQYRLASSTWSDYLEATDEPNAGTAQLMTSALVALVEGSRTVTESQSNLQAAVEAQQIVADQRPTLNSLTTLALYQYFNGESAAADKSRQEAMKKANTKAEKEEVEKQLDEGEKRAVAYRKQIKAAEKAEAAGAGGGGGNSLEGSPNPLGGGLGTGGFGE
jgi:predicted O-linked N-acetylglucosamine transferase (SPINDLY family)